MVRPATTSDTIRIAELHRDLYALHHREAPTLFKAAAVPTADLDVDLAKTLVYDLGGVVGFLSYEFQDIHESSHLYARRVLVVFDLVVDERHRRTGVGDALLAAVEVVARESGCDSLEIPVFTFNQGAIRFYEQAGYAEYVKRLRKVIVP